MAAMLEAIWEKKFYTLFFCIKGCVSPKFGAERPTCTLSQGGPLAMLAILAAILWKKGNEKLHLNEKVLRDEFG